MTAYQKLAKYYDIIYDLFHLDRLVYTFQAIVFYPGLTGGFCSLPHGILRTKAIVN